MKTIDILKVEKFKSEFCKKECLGYCPDTDEFLCIDYNCAEDIIQQISKCMLEEDGI